jgi:hypothetical protein
MQYAIQYFRDPIVVRWYQEHGIVDRPTGFVTGTARYAFRENAQRDADHINNLGPLVPVTVVRAS